MISPASDLIREALSPAVSVYLGYPVSDCIRMPPHLFKMDWLLMSIVLLCIMATILYSLISLLEKWCMHRF